MPFCQILPIFGHFFFPKFPKFRRIFGTRKSSILCWNIEKKGFFDRGGKSRNSRNFPKFPEIANLRKFPENSGKISPKSCFPAVPTCARVKKSANLGKFRENFDKFWTFFANLCPPKSRKFVENSPDFYEILTFLHLATERFFKKCMILGKNVPDIFRGKFPGISGISGISRNFPEISPEFSPIFLDFSTMKNMIFALYHCVLPQKTPRFSGNFPGIFRKFSGKIFANFRNFGNFPEISPGIFLDFPTFYKHKKIDLRAVALYFTEKTPRNFREIFRRNFFQEFLTFRKFSPKFSWSFPWISLRLY